MSVPPAAGRVLGRGGGRRLPTGLLILVALLLAIGLERRAGHGSTPPLAAVAFSDPAHGVGLFVASGTSSCVASAGTSSDGGAHFGRLVVLADWRCAAQAPVAAVASDGLGDEFAFGPRLLASHDAGATWSRVPVAGVVLSVQARGRSVWAAVAACAGGCALRVLTSSDGGRHWTPAAAPGADAPRTFAAPAPLVRTGPSSAYALSPRALSYSADGGATWSRRTPPCPRADSAALAPAPSGALLALCADPPSAGLQLKWLEVSADGGRSWSWRGPCGRAVDAACEHSPLTAGYLGSAVAVSAGTLFAIGDRSGLLVTRDGGRSWRNLQATVGDVDGEPAEVQFFGPRDGLVLGRRTATGGVAIWHTADGGRTWRALTPVSAS